MITGIDHIVIRCSNPSELMDEVRTQLDVPILIPAQDYEVVRTGFKKL
ncbi:MAG: aspartate/glutamate racemase family protein [Pleurocapsa sp. CRU_1_2]|nr:aspartate/glutamate racemase family protein [Pleurocapsa sp. CRU_1_2]